MFYRLQKQFSGWVQHTRNRTARRARTMPRLKQVEGLETRRVLASDMGLAGDCDQNGSFDTSDLVQAFQHGKFETGSEATWAQGDWNGDRQFNSSDLVVAFQAGRYDQPTLKSSSLDDNSNSSGSASTDSAAPTAGGVVTTGQPVDDSGNDVGDDHDHNRHGLQRAQKLVADLKAALASGDPLPGDMTAEQVTKLVTDLEAAIAAGNKDAARDILKGLHDAIKDRDDDDRPTPEQAKARIENMITGLQAAVDTDQLPTGITREQVVAAITAAKTALDAGDLAAARKAIHDLREAIHDAREDADDDDDKPGHHGGGRDDDHAKPTPDQVKANLQGYIDALQAAVDSDQLPTGITREQVVAAITAAKTALDAGDVAAARKVIHDLREAIHDAREDADDDDDKPGHHGGGRDDDHAKPTPDQVKANLQGHIDTLQAAVDTDQLPAGITREQVVAAITAAKTALDAGDLTAARKALNDLHEAIHDAREDADDDDDRDDEEDDKPAPPARPTREAEGRDDNRGRGGRR